MISLKLIYLFTFEKKYNDLIFMKLDYNPIQPVGNCTQFIKYYLDNNNFTFFRLFLKFRKTTIILFSKLRVFYVCD